jgi:multidrug efflux pump subunit AcrA (membrane-fusion protein)
MKIPGISDAERLLSRVPARFKTRRLLLSYAAGFVAIILLILLSGGNREASATVDVKRGEFLISFKSSGEIRAANSFTLTTPRGRYGQMQIVYLVPEGTTVKKGDVIVRFGTTDVDKTISDKEAELNINQSDYDKFKADRALQDAQLEADLKSAELAYEEAKLQVEKMKYEAEMQRKESEINLEKNRLAWEQAKRKIESQGVVDKSEERKFVLKVKQTQNDLAQATKEKDQYTLKAGMGGLVVYEQNWSTGRKVAVGDSPWGGMAIVSLPDLSQMQSITNINEVDISKVKKGQPVKIKLDAFPEKEFKGTVGSVGTIGQQHDQSSTKTFEVVVDIDGADPVLKPGMTTSNEVIMSSIPDTLYVPIEAVFQKDGKTIVYRNSRPQEVSIGAKNSNFVVVSGGIKAGDKVDLTDPTTRTSTTGQPQTSKQ